MNEEVPYDWAGPLPAEIEGGVIGVDWGIEKIVLRDDNRLWVEFWIK
jgi:hypothetical protein